MKTYRVEFSENGWEYTGYLYVDCNELKLDKNDKCAFYADGVKITIDEEIGIVEAIE
ncbi:MAG TPA: hypothetical protein PK924_05115 [Bacilli bacterium]|nr:hypothetical protein [Bacilli bacterium]